MTTSRSTTRHQRLYDSPTWRLRSRDQLRAEPLCRHCLERGQATAATHTDHIEPHNGNLDAFRRGELQSLCVACHNAKTKAEETARRTGRPARRKGCDADGSPLDGVGLMLGRLILGMVLAGLELKLLRELVPKVSVER